MFSSDRTTDGSKLLLIVIPSNRHDAKPFVICRLFCRHEAVIIK